MDIQDLTVELGFLKKNERLTVLLVHYRVSILHLHGVCKSLQRHATRYFLTPGTYMGLRISVTSCNCKDFRD